MLSPLGVIFPLLPTFPQTSWLTVETMRKDLLRYERLQYSPSHICIIIVILRGDNIMKKNSQQVKFGDSVGNLFPSSSGEGLIVIESFRGEKNHFIPQDEHIQAYPETNILNLTDFSRLPG